MKVRNLIISYDEHKCRIGEQNGTLKTISIVETLPSGKKKTVHSDIHFESQHKRQEYKTLLKLFRRSQAGAERRAA